MLITISGVVQGVGFRPFVYRLAVACQITGFVRNRKGVVEIEAQGPDAGLHEFLEKLRVPPRGAQIISFEVSVLACVDETAFHILESDFIATGENLFAGDFAMCADCLDELRDSNNRRFGYPFINCASCGPRFSIIEELPYDRQRTTMRDFHMCEQCRAEYENPADRRFHAQAISCPNCGPTLTYWESDEDKEPGVPCAVGGSSSANGDFAACASAKGQDGTGSPIDDDSFSQARPAIGDSSNQLAMQQSICALKANKIVCVKGLAGFHLMCRLYEPVIRLLRERKQRPRKPFAVLMEDLPMVESYFDLTEAERQLLLSAAAPIVLLKPRLTTLFPPSIAPGLGQIGVMLPSTPVQQIMLCALNEPLLCTSANISEEPITISIEDAYKKLRHVADAFLDNNRAICSRYDDSVVRAIDDSLIVIRRSRGMAPVPLMLDESAVRTKEKKAIDICSDQGKSCKKIVNDIRQGTKFNATELISLSVNSTKEVLAFGAFLKSAFCYVRGNKAYLSQHLGDLESIDSEVFLKESIKTYSKLFGLSPQVVAADLHPDYLSTQFASNFAAEMNLEFIQVQHHHAHIAAVMAENGLSGTCLGVALDGTGYGSDGTVWGGELLQVSYDNFSRLGHFANTPMSGGESSIRHPWRMALSYAKTAAQYSEFDAFVKRIQTEFGKENVDLVGRQIDAKFNSPMTSSCGRLFDAVSALLNVCNSASYEGQAAAELEALAEFCFDSGVNSLDRFLYDSYPSEISDAEVLLLPGYSIFQAVNADMLKGTDVRIISAKFHASVAQLIFKAVRKLAKRTGITTICCGGGVCQNSILIRLLRRLFRETELSVYFSSKVPSNDGGIALGQAMVALAKCGHLHN